MEPGEPESLDVAEREAVARRVAEFTRERDAAMASAAAERERTSVAMQQCEYLASEILAERRRHMRELAPERETGASALARAHEDQHELSHRLTHALQTIRNMERSRFWRMRMLWVRIRNLIG